MFKVGDIVKHLPYHKIDNVYGVDLKDGERDGIFPGRLYIVSGVGTSGVFLKGIPGPQRIFERFKLYGCKVTRRRV